MFTLESRDSAEPRRRASALIVVIAASLVPGCVAFRHDQPVDRTGANGYDPSTLPSAPWLPAMRPLVPDASRSADPSVTRTSAPTPSTPAEPVAGPSIPPPPSVYPIDLPSALRLAESINPIIGEARTRIDEAIARHQQARIILLPNLNAGADYDGHAGAYQRSNGPILNVDRQSVYFGGGSGVSASGTISQPAVTISAHLGEAVYAPLAARQRLDAARLDASATANTVLLGVSVDFLELEAAGALLEARRRTEAEAVEVARITAAYARTGEGRQADANRAETQHQLRRAEVRRAEERLAVASARLARRLHLDPSARIEPAGRPIEIFSLIDPDARLEDLLEVARKKRPEIGARTATVGSAETRVLQEKTRPLFPTLYLGFSGGVFGGGSNLVPPLVGNFRGRTDFDAVAYWTLLNFGAGNLARVKRSNAELGVAVADRDRTINLVREQVGSARGDALAKRDQIKIAVEQLESTQEGYRRDFERIKAAAGPPLEVLNNLTLLGKAREALVEAVLGYNQAQFRLFVAMGSPPPLDLPTQPAAPPSSIEALAATPGRERGGEPAPTIEKPLVPPAVATPAVPGEGTMRAGLDALARAKETSTRASSEYGRIEARLFETISKPGNSATREEIIRGLAALAEARRSEVIAGAEYDKTLWDLMVNSAPKDEDRETRKASNPPGP